MCPNLRLYTLLSIKTSQKSSNIKIALFFISTARFILGPGDSLSCSRCARASLDLTTVRHLCVSRRVHVDGLAGLVRFRPAEQRRIVLPGAARCLYVTTCFYLICLLC